MGIDSEIFRSAEITSRASTRASMTHVKFPNYRKDLITPLNSLLYRDRAQPDQENHVRKRNRKLAVKACETNIVFHKQGEGGDATSSTGVAAVLPAHVSVADPAPSGS